MKKIILLTWLACSMQMTQIFAHFAPRGFTGGTVTKGIRVPGFMFLGTQEGGVYRSTNNAISAWGTRSVGLLSGKINDFAYDGTSVIAATDRGLYIFDGVDGNDRFWRKIDAGLAKYFFPASSNQHFDVKINAVSVVNTNIGRLIFVGTDSGVYFTEDYGADFKEVDNVLLKSNTITGFLQTTGANNALLVSVKDKGLVINRTITAAYKDEDFTEFNDDNTRGESVKLLGVADDIISISKGDMVLGSTVATPSFTSVSAGLASGIDIYSLAYTSSRVFLATSGGLYSREKNELAWTLSSNSNLNSQSVNVVVATSDTLVVGISNLGVLKSTDNGSTWAATNTGLANIKTFALDAWGIRDAVSNVVVSATELGVAISRNLGLSPSLVNKGLTDSLNVTDVKIYPSYIYASTRNSGVFRIANNASSTTWEAVNQGLPSGKAIIKLFKVKNDVLAMDEEYGLWSQTAGENEWEEFIVPNRYTKVAGVLVYDDYLILADQSNVYYTSLIEPMWNVHNNGLGDFNITSLTEYQGVLYIGTEGSGVWYSDLKEDEPVWKRSNEINYDFLGLVTQIQPNVNDIQQVAVAKGYIFALFRGGSAATSTKGNSWIKGTHNHHLPSFSDFSSFASTSSRIFVSTPNNSTMSNGLSEITALDTNITLSKKTLDFKAESRKGYVSVSTNISWSASASDSWISIDENQGLWTGTLEINVSEFSGERKGYVLFTAGNKTDTLFINQNKATSSIDRTFSGFGIYPNPSKGEFSIIMNGAEAMDEVKIISMDGRVVAERTGLSTQRFTFNERLNPGLYVVQVSNGNNLKTKRITITE